MKIAILAPFGDFSSAYSLSHVVTGQADGLRRAGHVVEVWCLNTVRPDSGVTECIAGCIRPCLRPQHIEDDVSHPLRAGAHAHDITAAVCRFRPDVVITHDVMFQTGYIDFARAIHDISDYVECRDVRWFHYVHSVFGPDAHTDANWYRYRVPAGHSLIFPNNVNADALAQRYDVSRDRVFSCPNPRDPRAFWNVLDTTAAIVERYRLLTRDIVQVYPFCLTRYADKGVVELIRLFDNMSQHADVALVLADANGASEHGVAVRAALRKQAPHMSEDNLIFLGEFSPATRCATPNAVVSELFRFSNLFVLTSKGEACPLILAEAAMSGTHVVLNATVPALREYAHPGASFVSLESSYESLRYQTQQDRADYTPIGTRVIRRKESPADVQTYLAEVAVRLIDDVRRNPVLAARSFAFRTFSNDAVASRLLDILAATPSTHYHNTGVLS
jgi:glycosyltransferase involved in cell wall biosynthesis